MKISNLGSRGFTHHIILAAVVLVVAIGGTGYLVASHADSCPPADSGVSGVTSSGVSQPDCQPTSGTSAVSQPTTDFRKYKTLISQSSLGKVYACLDNNSAMYMRIVTNNATKLAYSLDSGQAANLNVPANSVVYRHVAVVGNRTFAAQVAKTGLKVTTAAPWTLGGFPACN